jgi:hypothetical protein
VYMNDISKFVGIFSVPSPYLKRKYIFCFITGIRGKNDELAKYVKLIRMKLTSVSCKSAKYNVAGEHSFSKTYRLPQRSESAVSLVTYNMLHVQA